MADIALTIQVADGKREKVTAPPEINTQEFIDQLVEELSFVATNGNGHDRTWRLLDLATGREMQPDKSLRANHVQTGQVLLLDEGKVLFNGVPCPNCSFRNEEDVKFCRSCGTPLDTREVKSDLRLFIHTMDDKLKECDVPGSFLARDLVGLVLSSSDPEMWTLHDKESGRDLNQSLSLVANQVLSGHNIYLRPRQGGRGGGTNYARLLAIAAIVLTVALGAAYFAWASLGKITVTPSSTELIVPGKQQFQALSRGKPVDVVWSIAPQLGSITPDGLYSAPQSVPSPLAVSIKAVRSGAFGGSASSSVVLQPSREQVQVAPESTTLEGGATSQFSAKVTGGTDASVRWTIQPELGSISAEGLYTAPATIPDQATIEVRATIVANPDRSATAHVTLEPVGVNLRPLTATLTASSNLRIAGTVTGNSDHTLRWSLLGPGSISRTGVYSAPSDITAPATARVTATSIADPGKSASASIMLRPVVAVAISPASGALVANQRARFSALVRGTLNTGVRWTLSGPGSLSSDGEYQAPASVSALSSARLTAASNADPTKTAEAVVSLRPITVSIAPSEVEVKSSQTAWLIATASGGTNSAVHWTLSGPGSISQQGIYSAPVLVRQDAVVRATATSTIDPSRSATATITLRRYGGPMSGNLIWTGTIEKNGSVTIDGTAVDHGLVHGDLFPALPIVVQLDNKDIALLQRPVPSNGWKRLQMSSRKARSGSIKISWKIDLEGETARPR